MGFNSVFKGLKKINMAFNMVSRSLHLNVKQKVQYESIFKKIFSG